VKNPLSMRNGLRTIVEQSEIIERAIPQRMALKLAVTDNVVNRIISKTLILISHSLRTNPTPDTYNNPYK
jgi:hypothetical protein